jgi:hypothetical protein
VDPDPVHPELKGLAVRGNNHLSLTRASQGILSRG